MTQEFFNGAGVARYLNRVESFGRVLFRDGLLPIEGVINGRWPVVSARTLKRYAPRLKRLPQRYKVH
jgi:hypothetical protein